MVKYTVTGGELGNCLARLSTPSSSISYFPFPPPPPPSLSPFRRVARPAALHSSSPLHRIVGTNSRRLPRLTAALPLILVHIFCTSLVSKISSDCTQLNLRMHGTRCLDKNRQQIDRAIRGQVRGPPSIHDARGHSELSMELRARSPAPAVACSLAPCRRPRRATASSPRAARGKRHAAALPS